MQIGVRGHDLNFKNIDELIEICKTHQIDGLQLVAYKSFEEIYSDENLLDTAIKKLQDNNIKIFLLGAYFNMIHPDNQKLQQGIDNFKYNIEIAKRNNIKFIGSETGSVNGDKWTYNKENHTEISQTKLLETIEDITQPLNDKFYLLEPVYDHVVYDDKIVHKMLVNKNIHITFDLANILNTKNYQDYLTIFDNFLNQFAPLIEIFHFKNFNIIDNQKVGCELSKGYIDYKQILTVINKYKLNNIPIIVEELTGDDLFNSIKFLQDLNTY